MVLTWVMEEKTLGNPQIKVLVSNYAMSLEESSAVIHASCLYTREAPILHILK